MSDAKVSPAYHLTSFLAAGTCTVKLHGAPEVILAETTIEALLELATTEAIELVSDQGSIFIPMTNLLHPTAVDDGVVVDAVGRKGWKSIPFRLQLGSRIKR